MTVENYIAHLIFQNNSIFVSNTFIDLDIVSTKNNNINVSIYPTIRIVFSVEGLIYIFVGNYTSYKIVQKYGIGGNNVDNENQTFKIITDRSDSDSYYSFSNNELKFISNKTSKNLSWNLTFLKDVSNIYLSNKNYLNNIDPSVSGLNFSLIASDSNMESNNIFRIDNTNYKSIADMGLKLNTKSISKSIKILYNNNYWNFDGSKKSNCDCNSKSESKCNCK
jgi:hypothetical protein